MIDVAQNKHHLKLKATNTLLNMRKLKPNQYIRDIEHNYNVAETFTAPQAKINGAKMDKEVAAYGTT